MHVQKLSTLGGKPSAESIEKSNIRPLQHFEHAVLQAVSVLGDDAYAAKIAKALSIRLSRHVSLAQVFISLERLEDKKFVNSRTETPTSPTRGGRRRRVFCLETAGRWALNNTAAAYGVSPQGETRDASQGQKVPSPA